MQPNETSEKRAWFLATRGSALAAACAVTLVLAWTMPALGDEPGKLLVEIDCTKDYPPEQYFGQGDVKVVESPAGRYREAEAKPLSRFGYRFAIEHVGKPHVAVIRYPDDKRRYMCIMDGTCYDLTTGVFTDFAQPLERQDARTPAGLLAALEGLQHRVHDLGRRRAGGRGRRRDLRAGRPARAGRARRSGRRLAARVGHPVRRPLRHRRERRGRQPRRVDRPRRHLRPAFRPESARLSDRLVSRPAVSRRSASPRAISTWWSAATASSTPLDDAIRRIGSPRCSNASVARGWSSSAALTLLRLGSLMEKMNIDLEAIKAGKETYQQHAREQPRPGGHPGLDADLQRPQLSRRRSTARWREIGLRRADRPALSARARCSTRCIPIVQEAILGLVGEIAERYGKYPAFKGISFNMWHATILWFASLNSGYDDYTVGLFEKETGHQDRRRPEGARPLRATLRRS